MRRRQFLVGMGLAPLVMFPKIESVRTPPERETQIVTLRASYQAMENRDFPRFLRQAADGREILMERHLPDTAELEFYLRSRPGDPYRPESCPAPCIGRIHTYREGLWIS